MSNVVIIVNAEVTADKMIYASSSTERMVKALKKAIIAYSTESIEIEVIAAASLWSKGFISNLPTDSIYCPLTIQLPQYFNFLHQDIYQACQDIKARRKWVQANLGYQTTIGDSPLGCLWLPIVLTQKGPLYGEVIGETEVPNFYEQPIDLPDNQRQGLYHLAYQLLEFLDAPPSVYLLQFALSNKKIIFDRLWPFPAAPAIASVGKQNPDLFACYWSCLNKQPVKELSIIGF
jgi:hypothetical protein